MNIFTRWLDRRRSHPERSKHYSSASLISGGLVVSVINGQLTPAGKQQLDYAQRRLDGTITHAPPGAYVPTLDEVRRTRDEIMAQLSEEARR